MHEISDLVKLKRHKKAVVSSVEFVSLWSIVSWYANQRLAKTNAIDTSQMTIVVAVDH